ncbi:protein of unknown function [Methylotuvimicrobium alcaliphilum 20Z]|uniref:Uncharacterized protein n=1 Tax=Methylotuvimicrobium alcaliphilum (strain DSM 19304 / NCIMB 14124 / VKM B-2133 / 20Z) TaxID=1091494 RepID=G4T0T5_META2|nr:protein of unknown function [Methylotuvimicrobium alcaliphilum 20Z]
MSLVTYNELTFYGNRHPVDVWSYVLYYDDCSPFPAENSSITQSYHLKQFKLNPHDSFYFPLLNIVEFRPTISCVSILL